MSQRKQLRTASFLILVLMLAWPTITLADFRIILTTGEYRMGDNDTRIDAKRMALLDAKRLALEQVGTYIEGITEVKNLDLAKEEIRAYTAGIVEVIEQATHTTMEGDTTVVRVDVTTRIDTEVVTRQIEALRKNEDVRTKLLRAESDARKLREQLDAKTHELATAKTEANAETATQQRQKLLTQADVENLVARARVVLAASKNFTLTPGTSTPESRMYARSLLEQALSNDPNNTDAQGLLGFVQFEEGHRKEAAATFLEITKKEPLSGQAHVNLGRVLEAAGDYVNAIKEYQAAITLEPDHAGAHASLGHALPIAAFLLRAAAEEKETFTSEQRQKWQKVRQQVRERAVEELREATRLAPRNGEYHRLLGEALFTLDKGDEGLAELHTAVALDPSDAAAHKALAERVGGEEAKVAYRAAIRLDPNDVHTHIQLVS